jgi:hypothetical protein
MVSQIIHADRRTDTSSHYVHLVQILQIIIADNMSMKVRAEYALTFIPSSTLRFASSVKFRGM